MRIKRRKKFYDTAESVICRNGRKQHYKYEKAFSHIDSAVLYGRLHIFITINAEDTKREKNYMVKRMATK